MCTTNRNRQRRDLAILGATIVALALPAGSAAAAAAATPVTFAKAVQITLPPDAHAHYAPSTLTAVSCVKAGDCEAGGWYTNSQDSKEVMVAAETNGHWARASELAMPAGADQDQVATVSGIACTGIGDCVAVGTYNGISRPEAYIATEKGGKWAGARAVTLPAGSAEKARSALSSIACTGPGDCVAVGGFSGKLSAGHMMAVTETSGNWKRARMLTPPAGAMDAGLSSVSCASTGNCSSVGDYETSKGTNEVLGITESAGHWQRARRITPPAGDLIFDSMGSVACPRPGACTAVGSYQDISGELHMMVTTESGSSWRQARPVTPLPSDAAGSPDPVLSSIACAGAASCVAVGYYLPKHSRSGALAEFDSAGSWSRAAQIVPPIQSALRGGSEALAVSCTRSGYCAAVGQYLTLNGEMLSMAAGTRA